jgi:PAS domain S-box-containing protein
MKAVSESNLPHTTPGRKYTTGSHNSIWAKLAWLPIPLFLIAIIALRATNQQTAYESRGLLIILNLLFSVAASSLILFLIGRTFLLRNLAGLLPMGAGIALWGCAGITMVGAGLLGVSDFHDANVVITIHNSCIWLSAVLQLVGATLFLSSSNILRSARAWFCAYAALALCAPCLIAYLTLSGRMPVFFIQGQGGTPVRDLVLGSSIVMLVVTAGLLRLKRGIELTGFQYWYTLGLGLLAVGLIGIMIQTVRATPLGWTGRAAQYLSGVYMLIAAVTAVRESGSWSIPLKEALRESENRFRSVLDNSLDCIYCLNLQTLRYEYVSPAVESITGYSPDHFTGRNYDGAMTMVHSDDIQTLQEAIERLEATGQTLTEYRQRTKDGDYRWLSNHMRMIRDSDGRPLYREGSIRDITEHKEAEEALARTHAEAERRVAEMESFIANMTEGVVLHDAQGKMVFCNQASREILETDLQTSIESRVEQFAVHHLDGTPMWPEETASARALKGETVRELRYKITSPSGSEKVISVNSSPVQTAEGTILGATTVFLDVTDKAEFERNRQELFEREHRIAEVLQQATLPPDMPREIMGYRLAVRYRPALNEAEIGGDFYDCFELKEGKFAIIIGDVVGKGLKAAIQVAEARHSIRSYAYLDSRPSWVLSLSNNALCRDAEDMSRMLTVFFAVVDPASNTMTYSVAGHDPPILCRSSGVCLELESHGMPMGIMPNIEYGQSSVDLAPEEILVMITDGITEARTSENIFFGRDGIIDFLAEKRSRSLDDIADGILDAATTHAGGRLQDDAAVVVLAVRPNEGFSGIPGTESSDCRLEMVPAANNHQL